MQEDRLVHRMLGGGVDLAADLATRRGTLLVVEQLRGEGSGGCAEALCRVDLEASQQQAASQVQVVVQGLALLANPVGQGQAGSLCLDQQRQPSRSAAGRRTSASLLRGLRLRGRAKPRPVRLGAVRSIAVLRGRLGVVRKRCSPPATCVSR